MAKKSQRPRQRTQRRSTSAFVVPATISRSDYYQAGSDDWFRDAIYRLVQVLGRLTGCREAFGSEIGLTGSQFAVLMGVAYRQGEEGMTIASLSSYVGLAATHVTTEVQRLIGKDLLIKRPHGVDKRSVLISLSASGAEAVQNVLPLVRRVNDALFAGISRDQVDVVDAVARQLLLNSAYALAEIKVNESLRDAPKAKAGGRIQDRRRRLTDKYIQS